jgi:hypothetical protein
MEILRVPPYPIATTWNLPDSNASYTMYIEDLVDHSIETQEITSDSNGSFSYVLPPERLAFDDDFLVRFYDGEDVVLESNLDIIRPYVNPNELGTTASEILEYKKWELIARSLIDTYTGLGFYNKKIYMQTSGSGTDYVPVWKKINKVLKVYENETLIFDIDDPTSYEYSFKITPDKTAIYRLESGESNRIESPTIKLPAATGDIATSIYNYGTFPPGYDYIFILDEGFKTIPPDIKYATEMLIEDLKCGRLDYYQRYVTSYNTDQFRIQFDKQSLEGTGNIIVDKILDKYMKSINKVGVL